MGITPYMCHDGMVECRRAAEPDLRLCVCCRGRIGAANDHVNLIPSQLRARLLANGARTANDEDHDPYPVVRLFVVDGPASWLLTELDPDDPDLAYGLCDLGLGTPTLDYVRLSDLASVAGEQIRCDTDFAARQPLSIYLREAREAGAIQP